MNFKIIQITLALVFPALGVLLFSGCESEAPNTYEPRIFIEGYLIVGEPVQNIIVQRSQPIQDSFKYDNSLIEGAVVKVIEDGGKEMILEYRSGGPGKTGYYFPDETYLVKAETEYSLEVELPGGEFARGQTTTPKEFNWNKKLGDMIYFPKDSINYIGSNGKPANDTLNFSWEDVNPFKIYLIRVRSLDTLEYGVYLGLPDESEMNRRIYKPWGENSRYYEDVATWIGPLPDNGTPLVWSALKWFGLNEVAVFNVDYNFLRWYIQVQRSGQYEEILSSLEGAMGSFGSASAIYDTSFVLKNQP